MKENAQRKVVVAVHDGVVLLDVAGATQVLHSAGRYDIGLASPRGGPVGTDTGVPLGAATALAEVTERVDTLLVPGYPALTGFRPPAVLVEEVRRIATTARRVVSVCTGAYVLAEAGLLDGRRATTHWAACTDFAARYPAVEVEPDAIYVRDGRVTTSAGVTAGIDLALALVEEDLGSEAALLIAKYLVVFLQRPGGQSQFSLRSTVTAPRGTALRRVVDAVAGDPAADHSLAAMAGRAAVSERHLTRLFQRDAGCTPAQYVERARVEAAQALLESGDGGVEAIARTCGFGSGETMRRAFLRVLGTTPGAYRGRFRRSHRPEHRLHDHG